MVTANATVIIPNPLGTPHVFLAGEEISDELASHVSNPAVFETSLSNTAGTDSTSTTETSTVAEDDEARVLDGPTAPPRAGRGSSVKAWADYAERIGIEYPDGADRASIIAAVDDALAE